MTEPPTLTRGVRYYRAVVVAAIVAVTFALVFSLVIYHALLWVVRSADGPGQIGFLRDFPGPFTGWPNHAVWYWVLFFVINLPKELVKAHRNDRYPYKVAGTTRPV
jgi:hypothetical protein